MTVTEKIISKTKFERDILQTARKAFETNGFYKTNIEDIARTLDIGKGTIYRHFGNKLMLFLSVVLFLLEESKIPLEKLNSIGTFENKMDYFISQTVKMTETSGNFIRVFLEEHLFLIKETYKDKEIQKHFQYFIEARKYFIMTLKDIVKQGMNEGKIPRDMDPLFSAELAIMTIMSYHKMINPLNKPGGKKHEIIMDENKEPELKKFVLRALGYNGL